MKETITFRIPKAIRENRLNREILNDFAIGLANYIDKISVMIKNRLVSGLNTEMRLIDDISLELTGEGFVFHVPGTDESAVETIDIVEHLLSKKTLPPSAIAMLILRTMRTLLTRQIKEHDELSFLLTQIAIV